LSLAFAKKCLESEKFNTFFKKGRKQEVDSNTSKKSRPTKKDFPTQQYHT